MKPEITIIYWCPKCNTSLNEDDEICPRCGQEIDWGENDE